MSPRTEQLAGPVMMLLSALIFGYFGFAFSWSTRGADGQFVLFPALLGWTLRVSAVLFLLSAGLTFVNPLAANMTYALVGVVGAGLFVVVALMDIADPKHTVLHPVVLLVFAAWNGYGSWSSLRAVLAKRSAPPAGE